MSHIETEYGMKIVLAVIISSMASILVSMRIFVETWIFEPAWALNLIIALVLIDMVTAVMASIISGTGFKSNKSVRTLFNIFGYPILLGIVFNLIKINQAFGFNEVTQSLIFLKNTGVLMAYIYISLSIAKNYTRASGATGKLARWVYNNIDVYKNQPTDKLNKKDSNDTPGSV